jgi:Holliday junction resolvase RusA-like endonuclease
MSRFHFKSYVIAPRPGHAPDLDNLDKPIIDALKSIVYLDDGQIRSRKSERLYCGESVSSANIKPPASDLQKTVQLQKKSVRSLESLMFCFE